MEQVVMEPGPRRFDGDFQTDFLSVNQLAPQDMHVLRDEAVAARWLAHQMGEQPVLMGHLYDLVFWDSKSTRTKESFKHAIIRLGAKFIDFHQETSSNGKGETFEDTIEMLDAYLVPERDGIIIRHNVAGSVARAAELADARVINAGDGTGEHPTQAVLDTVTVMERFPRLEEAHIVFFGDIARGRTVHSTAPLLAAVGVRHMTFVAPHEELRAPVLTEHLRAAGVTVAEAEELREVAGQADIIYALRTQYEFMDDAAAGRAKFAGKCLVKPEDLQASRALLMHPLPQDNQDINIHPTLRRDPRCIVKEQASWGEYSRMALLTLQAGKSAIQAARQSGMRLAA